MIRLLLIAPPRPEFFENLGYGVPGGEAVRFDRRVLDSDHGVESVVADFRPHVIITFLADGVRCRLDSLPFSVRRRWVNLPMGVESSQQAGNLVIDLYRDVVSSRRRPHRPSISVVTPTYNTGPVILRAYDSLCQQSYREWEWVVYDDSTNPDTLDLVNHLATSDPRITVVRSGRHSGWIGEVKRRAFRAAEGQLLLELDHDDELTADCLEVVAEAFEANPDCGFAYTDFAEVNPDGSAVKYGDTFGFGFGSYYSATYHGRSFQVADSPAINTVTMSHIVGVPNHARVWRREAYEQCGGHSSDMYVADDYELLVRTFLETRMIHVRHFGYIQHRAPSRSNTHILRNAEIQRQVHLFSIRYAEAIRRRAQEILGSDRDGFEGEPLNVEYRRNEQRAAVA
ncbi:MAG: hypothetical protein B7C54_03880 [Acidimicrobiales bacterium mtb01]|nr:glycosyltransferase [Actinomycetota bacterium]TEX46371.1 MAG: hypothetical protein B7C54_03880 [Acidimicrobiales bacterium mtb01]